MGRQRLGVGAGRIEKLLGDPERGEAELAALPPGSQSLCQLGQQPPVPIPDEPRLSSSRRCCLLRACCYAKLAARRCRLGPVQPLSAPRAGIPTCSECSPRGWGCPFPQHPRPFAGPLGSGLRRALGARRLRDAVPARRLQVRAGGAAVPGSARPGSAPRQLPGTSRALLKQKLLFAKPSPG